MANFIDLGTMGVINIPQGDEVVICAGTDEDGLPVFHFDKFSLNAQEAVKFYEWLGEWLRGANLLEVDEG